MAQQKKQKQSHESRYYFFSRASLIYARIARSAKKTADKPKIFSCLLQRQSQKKFGEFAPTGFMHEISGVTNYFH